MKWIAALSAFALISVSWAQETYLGMYLQGQRIGYSSYITVDDKWKGAAAKRTDSRSVMDAKLLGSDVRIEMDSKTWTSPTGRPVHMSFSTTSGGRSQKIEAEFGAKTVDLQIENSGSKSKRTLEIPSGGTIVDDPLSLVVANGLKPSAPLTYWVLDPTTASFLKNEVKVVGPTQISLSGKTKDAVLVNVVDPRASMKVFFDKDGTLLKVEAPMGITMLPEKKPAGETTNRPHVDLATSTSIRPDRILDNMPSLKTLKLRFSGKDLSKAPSDSHQTITKDGEGWIFSIHPTQFNGTPSVASAKASKPAWVKPGLNIPSDDPEFVKLAKQITAGKTTVPEVARAVQLWVNKRMTPNAGIGVLRDAREILKTKEGVCRDYAILTATLLRARGVPARLASGLVSWDGTFYYHAWVEVWDGSKWVGVDSTTDGTNLSASHVKLGDGNVEQAFTFSFLDQVKVQVLDARGG